MISSPIGLFVETKKCISKENLPIYNKITIERHVKIFPPIPDFPELLTLFMILQIPFWVN